MADNQTTTQSTAQGAATEPGHNTGQNATDWKAEYEKAVAERDKAVSQSRKWEERAKANKAKADKADQMEEASKANAEKLADAIARAEKAEAAVKEYETRAERAGIIREVAAAKKVDPELLDRMNGDTREQVEANADWLTTHLSATTRRYPAVADNGGKTTPVTKEQIEAIKDPAQRIRMRAQHINLYKK